MLKFACPKCHSWLQAAPQSSGLEAVCRCGQVMVIPARISDAKAIHTGAHPCDNCGENLALEASVCPFCLELKTEKRRAKDAKKKMDLDARSYAAAQLLEVTAEMPEVFQEDSLPEAQEDQALAWKTPPTSDSSQENISKNTRPCPYCKEAILCTAQKCKHCGEFMRGKRREVQTNVKQGALIGSAVCFVIGIIVMGLALTMAPVLAASIVAIVVSGPLFLAAFILSIVAMAQKRIIGGVIMLLLTVIMPLPLAAIGMTFQLRKSVNEAKSKHDDSMKEGENLASLQESWKKSHNVSEEQWTDMVSNYVARKPQDAVTEKDWWNEAKGKTPNEMNRLYPPKSPQEWYRAKWPDSFSRSRELDFSFSENKKEELKIGVGIETEPNAPIKELYGHLAFIKNNEVVYEAQISEKEKVSFVDYTYVILRIPYDDSNPKHRTLRFSKDSELTPIFTVRRVVFADGKEKKFGQEEEDLKNLKSDRDYTRKWVDNDGLNESGLNVAAPASEAKESADQPVTKATVKAASQFYSVRSGDTLASLSQKFFGDTNHTDEIYKANRKTIGANPNALKVGMKIEIPE